jgi:hypothetical protein
VFRLGIPDRFIEHAERGELLADLGLNVDGLCRAARRAFAQGREEDFSAVGEKGNQRMASTDSRHRNDEFASRGDEIYEGKVRPLLTEKDKGRIVAIDVDSGEYAIGDDELDAFDRLQARVPEAQAWFVRVGSRSVHRLGRRDSLGRRR